MKGYSLRVTSASQQLEESNSPPRSSTRIGPQFTAHAFIKVLGDAQVAISLDGVGRAIDNVFIERLWRTIKYDHIYLNPADSGNALRDGLETFIEYYNEDRPHSALGAATPDEVYYRSQLQQRAA